MALAGSGAVAIWHDIAPEGRDEFYAWHGSEHMPERVGIPGFRRGRRYVAVRPGLEFFNLYEARDLGVVTGPDYHARLNAPTPWTTATVKHFRNVARAICQVAASFGAAEGGLCATWRYAVPDEAADAHLAALRDGLLPGLAARRGIAGAHLLVADPAASGYVNAEQKARGGPANVVPRWVIVAEGWGDEAPFEALCREALPDAALARTGAAGPAEFGLYRLQVAIAKADG